MFDFEKFPVYISSKKFYLKLCEDVFSKKNLNLSLKNQIRRSSSSITLNIAEGAGKFKPRDKKNFYTIARGSTNECMATLELIKLESVIDENTYKELRHYLIEINKMITGLIKTMDEREANQK